MYTVLIIIRVWYAQYYTSSSRSSHCTYVIRNIIPTCVTLLPWLLLLHQRHCRAPRLSVGFSFPWKFVDRTNFFSNATTACNAYGLRPSGVIGRVDAVICYYRVRCARWRQRRSSAGSNFIVVICPQDVSCVYEYIKTYTNIILYIIMYNCFFHIRRLVIVTIS